LASSHFFVIIEMMVDTDPRKIQEFLIRGVERIYPGPNFLKRELFSGRRMKAYCGYDPSTPTLHLGHIITLRKLAQFQKLGHEVVMLIGDFTGMIGDPTDKLAVRKKLTRAEVLTNAKDYKKIASQFLEFQGKNPAKILYNSQWSDELTFIKLLDLASNFTVQQMIVREMFQERIEKRKPIYLHEFLYPLAQAYDSVAMNVDLEIGGRDQIFNMLCGRHLTRILKGKEKFVLATKLLVDPTGKKMGKTEGGMVAVAEDPIEMYGKIMSWPDNLIGLGFELLTNLSLREIRKISQEIKRKTLNPRNAKSQLAKEIVTLCHSKKSAEIAEEEFNQIFKEKKLPTKIPEISFREKEINILDLLVRTKLVSSKLEAKRLILQRGVKINRDTQEDWQKTVELKKGMIIQIGKRKFLKLV
jgi:tyrosyl-tRNA synthetase